VVRSQASLPVLQFSHVPSVSHFFISFLTPFVREYFSRDQFSSGPLLTKGLDGLDRIVAPGPTFRFTPSRAPPFDFALGDHTIEPVRPPPHRPAPISSCFTSFDPSFRRSVPRPPVASGAGYTNKLLPPPLSPSFFLPWRLESCNGTFFFLKHGKAGEGRHVTLTAPVLFLLRQ